MVRLKKTAGGTFPFSIGAVSFNVEVYFARRKTISLRVHTDGRIQVDAPIGTAHSDILAFMGRHRKWIVKHVLPSQTAPRRVALPHQYVDGEEFFYLGREYVLHLVKAKREGVGLRRGMLIVCVHDPLDKPRIQKLIARWYRQRAAHVYATRLNACYPRVAVLGVPIPTIGIRVMKTRWGSCSRKGNITLNLKLIQAPRAIIDYVLLHELCHLKEFNHSPRFWALMTHVLPDWKSRRGALERYFFSPF